MLNENIWFNQQMFSWISSFHLKVTFQISLMRIKYIHKSLGLARRVSSAHQSCIYLIKTIKYYFNVKSCFLCEYIVKCNLFLWSKLYFNHHYSSLLCHMILHMNVCELHIYGIFMSNGYVPWVLKFMISSYIFGSIVGMRQQE